jgi:hypothetical protein
LHLLSTPRRLPRPHEWSRGKAVTFIVTLAATRSVTLAAREAGMSRKSAYARKARDAAFAQAWDAALKPRPDSDRQGAEPKEVEAAPVSLNQGDKSNRAAPSTSSSTRSRSVRHAELDAASMNTAESSFGGSVSMDPDLRQDDSMALKREQLARERFFAMLATGHPDSRGFPGRRRTPEVARPSLDQ